MAASNSLTPQEEGTPLAISVKTIRPQYNPHYQITVSRPADVDAYYLAELEARVPGKVKTIRVDVGSRVEKDQLLVQLSVPDLVADAKGKENAIYQRERELKLAEQKGLAARSAVRTAQAHVEEKNALLLQAMAPSTYRDMDFQRPELLPREDAIDKNVRDEAEKDLEVSAVEFAAEASRLKAESLVEDSTAGVSVADAETERCRQLIDVARAEHEKTQRW